MRTVNTQAQVIRERRGAIIQVPMLWIEARNRSNGNIEALGLWSGEFDESIVVPDMFTGLSVNRTFYSGGVMELSSIRYATGIVINPVTVRLSSINAAVLQLFRAYDPRGCKVQIWRRCYDPLTRAPVGVEPWYRGFVNKAPIERPEPGGDAAVEVELVSTSRVLTIPSSRMKSHEAQLKRTGTNAPNGDKIRQYCASVRGRDIPWGTDGK